MPRYSGLSRKLLVAVVAATLLLGLNPPQQGTAQGDGRTTLYLPQLSKDGVPAIVFVSRQSGDDQPGWNGPDDVDGPTAPGGGQSYLRRHLPAEWPAGCEFFSYVQHE